MAGTSPARFCLQLSNRNRTTSWTLSQYWNFTARCNLSSRNWPWPSTP